MLKNRPKYTPRQTKFVLEDGRCFFVDDETGKVLKFGFDSDES